MKSLAISWVPLVLVCALATQAGAAPLTLPQCVEAALERSPLLSAYRHKTLADGYEITKTRGTTLPYLSSKLSTYMINGSPATLWTPLGINEPTTPINSNAHWSPVGVQEIGVSYPLYSQGSLFGLNDPPAVTSARATLTQDQLISIISAQKVTLDVSEAFINAASYRDQAALNQQLVQAYSENLEIIKSQVKLGATLRQQIDIINAELDAARQAEELAAYNEHNYSMQLAMLIGRHDEDGIVLDEHPLPRPRLPQLNRFMSEVMSLHPALGVQDAKVNVAQQQLKVDRASRLPTVTLNNDFAVAEDFDYFNGNSAHRRPTQFLSYLTVDIPIWDFGQRNAATLESAETVEYEKDLRRDLEIKLRTSITDIYGKIITDEKTVAASQSKYLSASKALQLAQAQRKQGSIDELALIAKEVDAGNAQLALEVASLSERINSADLQNLSGGIWHWMQ